MPIGRVTGWEVALKLSVAPTATLPPVNLDDVRRRSARELADSLDDLALPSRWEFGERIRTAARATPDRAFLPEPPGRRIEPFQNMVVGTMAERAFRNEHLTALEREGFDIIDYHERGENRDYAVERDGSELPLNVKVASTMFREARRIVGLDPNDCIPLPAYKAVSASERVPALLYVFLVDFTLRERVDALISGLAGPLEIVWHVLSWYAGPGARAAQDRYTSVLFERHGRDLMALVPDATSFRAISAQRSLAILRRLPRRVPGLGVKAAGRGVFQAEVNVHVSVRDETTPWTVVVDQIRAHGIAHALRQIQRMSLLEIPDPTL